MVDTLKYLAMGGRIGKAQALLGGVLQFKPIVGIRDGETHPVDRPRTRRRAQRRISELVRELALAAAQIDNGPSCKVLLRWYCGRS